MHAHAHTRTEDLFSRAIIIFLYRFSCGSFFRGLFHDSESNSEYTLLNGKMTDDDDLEKIWYERIVA
jgi:hypothetical protein